MTIENNTGENHDRWRYINWLMIILIACIGIVVVGLVSLGFFRASGLYRKYFPLTDASMEMRAEAISAYLWFEEMIGGDKSIGMDEILKRLDRADWYAEVMIRGGENMHLKLIPSKIPALREDIISLQKLLREQRDLLETRFATIQDSRPGSKIDKTYHEKLEKFITLSKAIERNIKEIMAHEYRVLKYTWLGVIACCLFLFLVAANIFYRYERIRRNHYLDILRMQQRMVQSEKMAALGTMIMGIAHEINNPNGFISFNIPILREYFQEILPILDDYAGSNSDLEIMNMTYPVFREDLFTTLENIENGSKRINRIVSSLKEFSKKKDHTTRIFCNLEEVIKKAVTKCGSKIRNQLVSLEVNFPEDLPQMACDPEIIELIIINFLTNAAEAAVDGDPRIKLNVRRDRKLNTVIIEVIDNGRGIGKSDLDKIFDPFYSTKSSRESTGLGLYLCNALVGQMGARLEVDSVPGQGSTFRLIIEQKEMKDS